MTIRDILNKIFWDPNEKILEYEVVFIHRGAYMDRKTLPCCKIKEIESSWFTYESEKEGEITIPFHRILEIRNVKTKQVVWKNSNEKLLKSGLIYCV